MIRLAVGMMFILINFAPDIGNLSINLLPDFVGYLLILSSLDKLKTKSPYFNKLGGLLMVMVVYKIVDYIIVMFSLGSGIWATIFFYGGMVATVIWLIIQYRVYSGIDDMAYSEDVRIGTGKLFTLFKIEAVLAVLSYANDFYRIFLNYQSSGKIIPGLSIPIFRLFSGFSEGTLTLISTFGTAMILLGIVIRILMIVFTFEACSDYEKIVNSRIGEK